MQSLDCCLGKSSFLFFRGGLFSGRFPAVGVIIAGSLVRTWRCAGRLHYCCCWAFGATDRLGDMGCSCLLCTISNDDEIYVDHERLCALLIRSAPFDTSLWLISSFVGQQHLFVFFDNVLLLMSSSDATAAAGRTVAG